MENKSGGYKWKFDSGEVTPQSTKPLLAILLLLPLSISAGELDGKALNRQA